MPRSTNPLQRRKGTSSPFSTAPRIKPGATRTTAKDDGAARLEDVGLVSCLAPGQAPRDVIGLIRYIRSHTFEEVPDRAAGMNSTRIAEILRFRQSLPPVVSIAHLHALSASTTQTERELALLVAQGKVRKVTIPGRGKGGAAVGDGVVVVEDWKARLCAEQSLDPGLIDKYILLMDTHPTSRLTSVQSLSVAEIRTLVVAGFLTNPAALSSSLGDLFALPTGSTLNNIAAAGSSAATGTLAAIGGYGAIHDSGGSGSALSTTDRRLSRPDSSASEMTLALPGTGAYLNLLVSARAHLLHLLKQVSPRHKEALRSFLKEKWDGNTPTDAISTAKRVRGEFHGVLPGKTKRWREFYGMEFDWILAECVGSGLVELFDTGSVGVAVRAR